jgi:hypothetical protein
MNKKLSIILTFVFFSIFFYSCADNGNFKPQVVKGVIDLRSWDFQKEVVSLDGDWEFYPYEFIEPGSIHLKKENHPVFLSLLIWVSNHSIFLGSYFYWQFVLYAYGFLLSCLYNSLFYLFLLCYSIWHHS